MLSSQVSLVWEGLPGIGRRTMQVGPFSALVQGEAQVTPKLGLFTVKNALWGLGFYRNPTTHPIGKPSCPVGISLPAHT